MTVVIVVPREGGASRKQDMDARRKAGHDVERDSRKSNSIVIAGLVPAIHVLLVFQRPSEPVL
jgi:hypothetical protein